MRHLKEFFLEKAKGKEKRKEKEGKGGPPQKRAPCHSSQPYSRRAADHVSHAPVVCHRAGAYTIRATTLEEDEVSHTPGHTKNKKNLLTVYLYVVKYHPMKKSY